MSGITLSLHVLTHEENIFFAEHLNIFGSLTFFFASVCNDETLSLYLLTHEENTFFAEHLNIFGSLTNFFFFRKRMQR